jgi:putative transposase
VSRSHGYGGVYSGRRTSHVPPTSHAVGTTGRSHRFWSSPPRGQALRRRCAYDSDAFGQLRIARGTLPVIPNQPTPQASAPFDPLAYRFRNPIEYAFCRLKDRRRIATRYDKLAVDRDRAPACPPIDKGASEEHRGTRERGYLGNGLR